jgi:hypothetical protein
MAEQPQSVNLHQLAEELREADHLGPEAQRALADLLDELGRAVTAGGADPTATAHLAASASHLAAALHQRQEPGVLAGAVERFETAVARAEAKAPLAAGIAHRLIETLANLGI